MVLMSLLLPSLSLLTVSDLEDEIFLRGVGFVTTQASSNKSRRLNMV